MGGGRGKLEITAPLLGAPRKMAGTEEEDGGGLEWRKGRGERVELRSGGEKVGRRGHSLDHVPLTRQATSSPHPKLARTRTRTGTATRSIHPKIFKLLSQ